MKDNYTLEFYSLSGAVVKKQTISASSYDDARRIAANRLFSMPEYWGVNTLIASAH